MAMPAAHAIRLEVISIHGENLSSPQRFGRYDQRRVREVHRVIGVEQHQFKRASEGAGVEKPDRQTATLNELPESTGFSACRSEHVKRLGQYRDRCLHGLPQALQDCRTTAMVGVPAIEQRHQRPRVDQDHRRSFFLMAARTARFVSLDGAMADPPGPWSSS